MTLYEFKALTGYHQTDALLEQGVLIAERTDGYFKFSLFQIDAFYVELKRDAKTNKALTLKSFSSVTPLDPYLKKISIPNFLKNRK